MLGTGQIDSDNWVFLKRAFWKPVLPKLSLCLSFLSCARVQLTIDQTQSLFCRLLSLFPSHCAGGLVKEKKKNMVAASWTAGLVALLATFSSATAKPCRPGPGVCEKPYVRKEWCVSQYLLYRKEGEEPFFFSQGHIYIYIYLTRKSLAGAIQTGAI